MKSVSQWDSPRGDFLQSLMFHNHPPTFPDTPLACYPIHTKPGPSVPLQWPPGLSSFLPTAPRPNVNSACFPGRVHPTTPGAVISTHTPHTQGDPSKFKHFLFWLNRQGSACQSCSQVRYLVLYCDYCCCCCSESNRALTTLGVPSDGSSGTHILTLSNLKREKEGQGSKAAVVDVHLIASSSPSPLTLGA